MARSPDGSGVCLTRASPSCGRARDRAPRPPSRTFAGRPTELHARTIAGFSCEAWQINARFVEELASAAPAARPGLARPIELDAFKCRAADGSLGKPNRSGQGRARPVYISPIPRSSSVAFRSHAELQAARFIAPSRSPGRFSARRWSLHRSDAFSSSKVHQPGPPGCRNGGPLPRPCQGLGSGLCAALGGPKPARPLLHARCSGRVPPVPGLDYDVSERVRRAGAGSLLDATRWWPACRAGRCSVPFTGDMDIVGIGGTPPAFEQ
jgi:hypothetical protein